MTESVSKCLPTLLLQTVSEDTDFQSFAKTVQN